VPIREDFPTPGCTNAYGWTKLMMEQVFKDVQKKLKAGYYEGPIQDMNVFKRAQIKRG
jgi:UDP-glucose 4-epimerase